MSFHQQITPISKRLRSGFDLWQDVREPQICRVHFDSQWGSANFHPVSHRPRFPAIQGSRARGAGGWCASAAAGKGRASTGRASGRDSVSTAGPGVRSSSTTPEASATWKRIRGVCFGWLVSPPSKMIYIYIYNYLAGHNMEGKMTISSLKQMGRSVDWFQHEDDMFSMGIFTRVSNTQSSRYALAWTICGHRQKKLSRYLSIQLHNMQQAV